MKTSLLLALAMVLFASIAHPQELPHTRRLEWPEADLSERLIAGAHRFVERKIAEAPAKRSLLWARDYSSTAAYARSVEPNRGRLRVILGVVDDRLPAAMERYGDESNPALVAETARIRIYQVGSLTQHRKVSAITAPILRAFVRRFWTLPISQVATLRTVWVPRLTSWPST